MKNDLLHSILQDVRLTGSAQLHKRKLLWLLGRQNDNASAWGLLLDEWEEIAGDRSTLHGTWHGDTITLLNMASQQLSTHWAVS